MIKKKYSVYRFPRIQKQSYLGTPWKTDYYLVALLFAFLRMPFATEVRIVNHKTGKHTSM